MESLDSTAGPALEAFFLGKVDFDACLALKRRLVFEAGGRADGQVALLLCEHPDLITVGRLGSREHVRLPPRELESRGLDVRWVNRGGGAILHTAGQMAVYPIVPLHWHGYTVGEYLARLQSGLLATLEELGVAGHTRGELTAGAGIWGRTGQLVTVGCAVKSWTTYFGAYMNVDPALKSFRDIDSDPVGQTPASSLSAERQKPVKMAAVRATIVGHLAHAFGCQRYHLYTGHPLVAEVLRSKHESLGRAP